MSGIVRFWRSERLRRVVVAMGVVYLFIAAGAIVILLVVSIRQSSEQGQMQTDQHNVTTAELQSLKNHDKTLAAALNEVKFLAYVAETVAAQDHAVISQLPTADQYLGQVALNLIKDIQSLENSVQSLCNVTGAACASFTASLPKS